MTILDTHLALITAHDILIEKVREFKLKLAYTNEPHFEYLDRILETNVSTPKELQELIGYTLIDAQARFRYHAIQETFLKLVGMENDAKDFLDALKPLMREESFAFLSPEEYFHGALRMALERITINYIEFYSEDIGEIVKIWVKSHDWVKRTFFREYNEEYYYDGSFDKIGVFISGVALTLEMQKNQA